MTERNPLLPPGEGRVTCAVSIEEGGMVVHMYRVPFDEPVRRRTADYSPRTALVPSHDEVTRFLIAEGDDTADVERPAGPPGAAIAWILGHHAERPFTTFELAAKVYPDEITQARKLAKAEEEAAKQRVFRTTAKVAMAIGRPLALRCLSASGLHLQRGVAQSKERSKGRKLLLYRAVPNDRPYVTGPCEAGRHLVNWQVPTAPPE